MAGSEWLGAVGDEEEGIRLSEAGEEAMDLRRLGALAGDWGFGCSDVSFAV